MNTSAATTDYVRTFNRYEYKYLLHEDRARAFIRDLEPYTIPDPYSPTERGYPIYSIYWDSKDWVLFWEKIDGQKYRRKLRFRAYEHSDDAFVEIKQRIDQTVQKRRVQWPQSRIAEIFRDGRIDVEREYEVTDSVGQEALFLCRHYSLEPKMAIAYRRRAYFGAHEHELRITFDTRLQYDSRMLDIRERFEVGKYLLPADVCVLEIKFNHFVPRWLIALVGKHDLRSLRFSKYCRAVDLEFFGGQFT